MDFQGFFKDFHRFPLIFIDFHGRLRAQEWGSKSRMIISGEKLLDPDSASFHLVSERDLAPALLGDPGLGTGAEYVGIDMTLAHLMLGLVSYVAFHKLGFRGARL